MLWLDLWDASENEECEVREALGLNDFDIAGERLEKPALEQREDHVKVSAVGVSEAVDGLAPETVAIYCFVGNNWVLTLHATKLAVIDDFRGRAGGGGQIGMLDEPSFLAVLLGWAITSYQRAFDRIEVGLEEFDLSVLRSTQRDAERQIGALVEVRRQVARLSRSLLPHREVFAALSDPEFDPISTEESAKRFSELAAKTDAALASARDAKDAITASFDVLIAREGHRTNEIMKVLALASITLLPGVLIAGAMGMNVHFKASVFLHSPIFWVAVAAIC